MPLNKNTPELKKDDIAGKYGCIHRPGVICGWLKTAFKGYQRVFMRIDKVQEFHISGFFQQNIPPRIKGGYFTANVYQANTRYYRLPGKMAGKYLMVGVEADERFKFITRKAFLFETIQGLQSHYTKLTIIGMACPGSLTIDLFEAE
jgi:hypothetical protein